MNILMLVNARPMNCLMTWLLHVYSSSKCFLDMLHSLISSYPSLMSKHISVITRPAANFFTLSCPIHFKIFLGGSRILTFCFPLHFTLILNKNFKLHSVPSCKKPLYNQRCHIKPPALF